MKKPTEGTISFGGHDITKLTRKSLYNNKTAVFQDFVKYVYNLKLNISISNLGDDNFSRLVRKCKEADLDPYSEIFPTGYDTMLSREFGGVDLSGGEWQRVAIVRGLYRKNEFIILDEPTAAIDPIEESNVYRKFVDIAKGKTVIIITHRLGSVKIADRIVVMKHGEIVEVGTHDELIEKQGEYRKLFNMQAQWYVDTKN